MPESQSEKDAQERMAALVDALPRAMVAPTKEAAESVAVSDRCRRSTAPIADHNEDDLVLLANLLGSGRESWPCVQHDDPHNWPMKHTSGPCSDTAFPPGAVQDGDQS